MSNSFIWRGSKVPENRFALDINAPIYRASDGNQQENKDLIAYCYSCESILENESLVSEVIKSDSDPYKFTQYWKQHNLLDDSGKRLNGDHLDKFPNNPVQKKLFDKIRENYLLFLAEMKLKRSKCWIHAWANILRDGEFISEHCHSSTYNAYLSGCYYPHSSDANLMFRHPTQPTDILELQSSENVIVFFPSWIPHYSEITSSQRISIAFDLVSEEEKLGNPWRPFILLDDPETMKGL